MSLLCVLVKAPDCDTDVSRPKKATSFCGFEKFSILPISANRYIALILPTSG